MDYITVDGEQVPVPEGASEGQLRSIAAQHRARRTTEGKGALTRGLVGAATTVAEPLLGIGQLVYGAGEKLGLPGAAEKRQQAEADIAKVRGARSGAGTAGTVGEVATFAVGGLGTALPRTLARAAGRAAVEQGVYEASRGTLEGDPSRLARGAQGAAWGAGGGAVGHALPAALSRVARPVTASAPVQAVVQQFRSAGLDPRLTLGQALNGRVANIEEALAAFPGTGIRPAREAAVEEWNRAQLINAGRGAGLNIGPRDIPRAGHRGVEVLQREKNALYDKALDGAQLAAPPGLDPAQFVGQYTQRLTPDDAAKVGKTAENLLADIQSGNVRGEKVKEIDSELREMATKAYRDGQYELGRAYEQVHGHYRNLMDFWMEGSRGMDDLTKADALYARLVPLQNAAAMQGSLARGGVFTPSQVLSQIRTANPKSTLARGGARGQDAAEAAQQVYGGSIPEVGPGSAEKILGSLGLGGAAAIGADALTTGNVDMGSAAGFLAPVIAAAALTRPSVARAAIGETGWQQALQRSPQWLAAQARIEALRGPTRAAAARLAQEQEDERRRRQGY